MYIIASFIHNNVISIILIKQDTGVKDKILEKDECFECYFKSVIAGHLLNSGEFYFRGRRSKEKLINSI